MKLLLLSGVGVVYNSVVVRLGEYMVRRTHARKFMVSRLIESISRFLRRRGYRGYRVEYVEERIIIDTDKAEAVARDLSLVPGISSTAPSLSIELDMKLLIDNLIKLLEETIQPNQSFSIRIHRGIQPIDSKGLEEYLGSIIHEYFGNPVNLVNPDLEIIIEFRGDRIYLSNKVFKGIGGLPYGSEGCLVTLVSGGIDSAVASWYAMKRGAEIIPVYINLYPYWSQKAVKRAYESIELIWKHVPWDYMKAYIVHGVGNIVAKARVPDRLRCLFCKANMYRIASIISMENNCQGIVTGEAVGQVASQTLKNMYVTTTTCIQPIYRPLAFMDKIEINRLAHTLGFSKLDTSVGKCMLKPPYPQTKASQRDLEILLKALDETTSDIIELLEKAEIREYSV